MDDAGDAQSADADGAGVRQTYDRIADHFAATREYPWPEVESFLDDHADGGRGLDLGCGNGRHAEAMADRGVDVVALDASRGLLNQAVERARTGGFAAAFVQGDAGSLPFDADSFDVAVYVATLHHLRPRASRVASLSELARVLAPDGRALVSAWSTAHDRFDADEGFDTTVDWTLPGGERVPRYYHIYDPDEFRADLADSALRAVDVVVSSGNCYAVVGPE
jgi:ubiquinone/menaquinone biosynthesis C-methylase UbiE